jgi:hypothetical protein
MEAGGLINILTIVFSFICNDYSNYKKNDFLFNELFEYVEKGHRLIKNEDDYPTLKRDVITTENLLEIFNNKNSINENTNKFIKEQKLKENVLQLNQVKSKKDNFVEIDKDALNFELMKPKRKTLNFGYRNLLKFTYCKSFIKSKNVQTISEIYKMLEKYAQEKMDIVYYIKSLEQLERLKLIVLNYEQNLSFDFIKRPNLADKTEMCCFEIDFQKNKQSNALQVINYYRDRVIKGELDEKDIELYPLLEDIVKHNII